MSEAGTTTSARSLLGVPSSDVDERERAPLFPSDPGVPRRRRSADGIRLLVNCAVFVLLGWAASGDPEADARLSELVADLPSWLRTLAWVGYTLSAIAALVLLAPGVNWLSDEGYL